MNFINNTWMQGNGSEFNSLNPANQVVVWTGKSSNKKDVDDAVNAAKDAFKTWSKLDFNTRLNYIKKFTEILKKNIDDFAKTIHTENGKPIWGAKGEIELVIEEFSMAAENYKNRTGAEHKNGEINAKLVHRPIGVMVVFGPFNFPIGLPCGHILPALIAGNTIVFKSTEINPKIGEQLVKYLEMAGLPKGVVNLVQGSKETGEFLVNNKNINGVLFTGSSNVGKAIHKNLAGRPEVILALEMGGNNPLVIDDEISDLDAAVYYTVYSAFFNSGQVCVGARRLFVPHNKFGEKFLSRLVEVASKIAISDGVNKINIKEDNNYLIGPVVSINAAKKIIEFKNNLLNKFETKELLELRQVSKNSALLTPGIILNIDKNFKHVDNDEECFGPLLQVFYYSDFADAVQKADDTNYGLSAALLSDNKSKFDTFYNNIGAGVVNWNQPTNTADIALPFGGRRSSGNHRAAYSYSAYYCSDPVATRYCDKVKLPEQFLPGIYL